MKAKSPPTLLTLVVCTALIQASGCGPSRTAPEHRDCRPTGFYLQKIALLPAFTTVRPLENNPDAALEIQVYLSVHDQFDNPIKTLGHLRFELFRYRSLHPDPRGRRFEVNGIQEIDLTELKTNQQHWDPITQAYHLTLKPPDWPDNWTKFVLQATFVTPSEYRLEDRITVTRNP